MKPIPLKYLKHRATVQRQSSTRGSAGGLKASWTDHITELPCLIQPRSGKPAYQGGTLAQESTHILFCLPDADISTADRILHTGRTYQILFIADAGGAGHHYEVLMKEVSP